MSRALALALGLVLFGHGCGSSAEPPPSVVHPAPSAAPVPVPTAVEAPPAPAGPQLRELRRTHTTTLFSPASRAPAPRPPQGVLELVRYPAPLGENRAYVTPVQPGPRRPALVWIHGGFDFDLESVAWATPDRANDQSGRAFREAGIVEMFPSFRGSNDNPGHPECFFGEVEDAIAAADFLATRADVDPARIYLGGHSTGGTLAMLVAESTDRFRGVIALGPIDDLRGYGEASCLAPDAPETEALVRTPIAFVDQIRTPTFVIEGNGMGNREAASRFYERRGHAPVTVIRGASDRISDRS